MDEPDDRPILVAIPISLCGGLVELNPISVAKIIKLVNVRYQRHLDEEKEKQ